MTGPALPPDVLDYAARGADWADFVARLRGMLGDLLAEWELNVDGHLLNGSCSLVVPVRGPDGPAMLKIGFPDDESEHEALGLRRWGGDGAVRLLAADPHRRAVLLERLSAVDLASLDVIQACEVVAGLYARLHVPAPARLRSLTSYVDRWTSDLARLPRGAPVPRRLVEQALSLGHDLVADPASTGTLIHCDLHYENVLAAEREPWLVIDPKPVSGDPHYEVAPMLWNRWEEIVASGDVRAAVRRRFHAIVDTAGLDEDRARAWAVVRMMHNAMWEIEDHPHHPDPEWLTSCIAVAKAVQD